LWVNLSIFFRKNINTDTPKNIEISILVLSILLHYNKEDVEQLAVPDDVAFTDIVDAGRDITDSTLSNAAEETDKSTILN
jgi:hypothetical protein